MNRKNSDLAVGNDEHIDLISNHIEKYVGPIHLVFHEIISEEVHIDVFWVAPSEKLPYNVLITSGMSSKPMNVPEGLEEYRFAELCILLPPDWPLDDESLKNEDYYWPIRWLKTLARFPHEYNTFFFLDHSVGGEGSEPFASNCQFCGFLINLPFSLNEEFISLPLENDDTIRFYSLIPLYEEEIKLKTEKGVDELLDRLDANGVTDVVDIHRPRVC